MKQTKSLTKESKTKCTCGCGRTLYIADMMDGDIAIGAEKDGRKSMKRFDGVIIKRDILLQLLTAPREAILVLKPLKVPKNGKSHSS